MYFNCLLYFQVTLPFSASTSPVAETKVEETNIVVEIPAVEEQPTTITETTETVTDGMNSNV